MKPHLRLDHGIWVCDGFACVATFPDLGLSAWDRFIGHGYTYQLAYADWQEQTRAARNAAQL